MLAYSYKLTIKESVSLFMNFAISDSFINPRALSIITAGIFLNLENESSTIPSFVSVIAIGIL